jgi:hypothetical protein
VLLVCVVPVAADGGKVEAGAEGWQAADDLGEDVLGELRPATVVWDLEPPPTVMRGGEAGVVVVSWGLEAPPPVAGGGEAVDLVVSCGLGAPLPVAGGGEAVDLVREAVHRWEIE